MNTRLVTLTNTYRFRRRLAGRHASQRLWRACHEATEPGETEPKGPPGGGAVRDEGVSLFEVGDRQQQVEGVAGRVEPRLLRPAFGRAQVGCVGVIEHPPADGQHSDQPGQDEGGAIAVADRAPQEPAPGPAGPAAPPPAAVGPTGLLLGNGRSPGTLLVPGPAADNRELLIRLGRITAGVPAEPARLSSVPGGGRFYGCQGMAWRRGGTPLGGCSAGGSA
jgi:hypothetical protein